MNFYDKLTNISKKNDSLLCVGLDSDINKIPQAVKNDPFPQFAFNKAIVDATHDLVCAYKPNSAYYEAFGSEGIRALKMTCDYIREMHPEIIIILDAKRGDIGNTNTGYVAYAYDYLGVDAITLHPFLGKEALAPFLERKDKGCFILCRTSNPGAGEFQDMVVSGKPLYQQVAEHVVKEWNSYNNCGLVVGATYPTELAIIRKNVGSIPLLIPGVGAQGGDVEKTVKAGVDKDGGNAIINSGRSILFASGKSDFAQAARKETLKLKDTINVFRGENV